MATTMRTAARSAKFANFLVNRATWSQGRRTYLSAQYGCHKEWEEAKRGDPLLQNVDTERLFVDVSRWIANKSGANVSLDVDILVNSFDSEKLQEELAGTLNRFRRSKYCPSILPSTSAAVVRYCLKHGLENQLIEYLEDRLNYGIFPDTQTLNVMLEHFLTRQMFRNAAKVAVHLALQEDPGNEISKTLSLIACERYLSSGGEGAPWKEIPVGDTEEDDDDDEIEYVRVPHVTNPWFDDHFDLTDPNDLVGEALVFFGRSSKGVVRESAMLIGLARRRKWEDFKGALAKVTEVSEDTRSLCLGRIAQSATPVTESSAEAIAQKEGGAEATPDAEKNSSEAASTEIAIPDWVEGALSKLKTSSATLLELLEADAKQLGSVEDADIKIQKEAFLEFVERRKAELVEKDWQTERRSRFQVLKQKKKELIERTELLYVFENWNKIELILKEVEAEKEETQAGDEQYIPPEVNARHRKKPANAIEQTF